MPSRMLNLGKAEDMMRTGRTIKETELRAADFYLCETRVTDVGEVDFHRPWDPTVLPGIEIRVNMIRKSFDGNRKRLDFDTLTVHAVNAEGADEAMRVLDDTGRAIDGEMVEVIGWEKLEEADPEILEGYMESRLPSQDEEGTPLAAGSVLTHPRPGQEEPHFVPA